MKIAICGPEATGKTTLANGLAKQLGLDVLPDLRGAGADFEGYHTAFEAAKVRPYWEMLIERQVSRESGFAHGVIDVSALDAWVLFMRWGWNHVPPARVDQLECAAKQVAATYTHVVLMPDAQVAPFAGHRFLNGANARRIHRLTDDTLRDWASPSVLRLQPDSEGTLLEKALTFIQGK